MIDFDIENSTVYIGNNIDTETSLEFHKCLNRYKQYSKLMTIKKPLEMVINSDGGSMLDVLSMIDLIRKYKSYFDINTFGMGTIYSSAFPLWLMGTEKTLAKSCFVMWHDASCELGNINISEGKYAVLTIEKMRNVIDKIILNKTRLTEKDLKTIYESGRDRYFNRDEIYELLR